MAKRKRSGGKANARTPQEHASNVVSLSPGDAEQVRRLADASRVPEMGRRTPQPTIQRLDRHHFDDLTPSTLIAKLRKAKDGWTEELADLWHRMLESDAHLRSTWETRMAPVYGARDEVHPADADESRAPLAENAAKGCEEAWSGIEGTSRIKASLLEGVGLGYGVSEIIWGRGTLLGRPATVPRALVPIQPRRFAFSDDFELGLYDSGQAVPMLRERGWPVEEITSRGRPLARLPAGKYIVHQPVSINDYPTSTGLVFSLSRWWLLKLIGAKFWAAGCEQFAMPRYVGHVPDSATSNVIDDLHAGLERLSQDGVAVARGASSIEVLTGGGESGARTWAEFMKYQDAAISKCILGSTLNVEIGESGGNRAAAESQADTTIRPRQEQDAQQLWASIRRDLFRYIVEYNRHLFPEGTPLPNGHSVVSEEPVQIEQWVIDTGLVRKNQILEAVGLPPLPDEEGDQFYVPTQQAYSPDQRDPMLPDAPVEDRQKQALNGAQVASMLEVVQQVSQGLLPRNTGIEIIVSAFPISRPAAEQIMGTVGAGFEPSVQVDEETDQADQEGSPPDAPEVGDVPLAPWEQARAMSRTLTRGHVPTSSHSPTTSETAPSD